MSDLEVFWPAIEPVIERARTLVESGAKAYSVAFVLALKDGCGMAFPVPIITDSEKTKQRSARLIEYTAKKLRANAILTVCDVWTLPEGERTKERYKEVIKQYGSLQDYPGHLDAISFALETHNGFWMGMGEVTKADGKRTFGKVDLQPAIAEGTFVGLLPQPAHVKH